MINAKEHPKNTISVKGKNMAYVEMGEGDPIVFQHGNQLLLTFGATLCRTSLIKDVALRSI